MYDKSLWHGGHTRRFRIREAEASGWVVLEERDDQIVRASVYHDWHRVERARSAFQAIIGTLQQEGWIVRRTQA